MRRGVLLGVLGSWRSARTRTGPASLSSHHDVGRALGDAEDVAVGALELALSTLGAGVKGYEVELLVFVALDEILPGCFEHHKVEIVAGGLLPLGSQRGLEQHTFVRLARRVCRASS